MWHVSDKLKVLIVRCLSQGVRALAVIWIARLLLPADYGQYELLIALTAIVTGFGDLGIYQTVMKETRLSEAEVRDTALVYTLLYSSVYAVVGLVCGLIFAWWEAAWGLLALGALHGATVFCTALYVLQTALLAREQRLVRWAGFEAVSVLVAALTGIVVALVGGSYFAPAAQAFVPQLTIVAIVFYLHPLAWPRHASRSALKQFFRFGWPMGMFLYVCIVQTAVLRLVVGWIDGKEMVGVLGRAIQVRDLIGYTLLTTFELILLPLMARALDHRPRLVELYLRGSRAIALLTCGGAAWLWATSPDLIGTVYGENWKGVTPLLTVVSLGLLPLCLSYPSQLVAVAAGKPRVPLRFARWQLYALAVGLVVYCLSNLWWGCVIWTAVSVIMATAAGRWGQQYVGLTYRRTLACLAPVYGAAAVSAVVMWGARLTLTGHFPEVVRLIVCTLAGAATASVYLFLFAPATFADIRSLVRRAPPPSGPAEPPTISQIDSALGQAVAQPE